MKIDTQILEDHQAKIKVETEAEQLEEAMRRASREIAKRTKIPGFRPGKAPYHMVERFVGKPAILEEALEMLVQDIYPKAIEESGIKPYGPGKLEDVSTDEPPTFEFIVPLEAKVEVGDYHEIRIPYELKEVTGEDVDKVVENIREQQAIIAPAERPAEPGDMVQVLMGANLKNPQEDENPTLIRERSVPVTIETNDNPDEFPYPGFSQNLVGLSAGDEKTIDYTYPEDSAYELLRGKEAEFKIVVEDVKSRTLPEVNDDLAAGQGEYENLEALRTDIHNRLEERARSEYDEEYEDKLIDQLVEASEIKFSPQMLEDEREAVLRGLENRLSQQNMDLETYLKTRQMTKEALLEELTPVAEKRLKRFLVLFEVSSKENIQVKSEDVQNETMQTLNMFASSMTPEQARKAISRDMVNNLASTVTTDLLVRNTLDRLKKIAKGEYTGPEEVVEAAEEEALEESTPSQPEDQSGETRQEEEKPVEAE